MARTIEYVLSFISIHPVDVFLLSTTTMSEPPFTQNVAKRLMNRSPEHQHRQAHELTPEGRSRSTDGLLPDGYIVNGPYLLTSHSDQPQA